MAHVFFRTSVVARQGVPGPPFNFALSHPLAKISYHRYIVARDTAWSPYIPCTSLNVWMRDLPCAWRNLIAYHCSVYRSCSLVFISQHTFHQQALRKQSLYASTCTVHDKTRYTDVEWVYLKPYTGLFVRQCCHFVYACLSQSFLISLRSTKCHWKDYILWSDTLYIGIWYILLKLNIVREELGSFVRIMTVVLWKFLNNFEESLYFYLTRRKCVKCSYSLVPFKCDIFFVLYIMPIIFFL